MQADDLATARRVNDRIYPLALALLARDRLRVVDGRCTIDGAAFGDATLMVPALARPDDTHAG